MQGKGNQAGLALGVVAAITVSIVAALMFSTTMPNITLLNLPVRSLGKNARPP
jgi:hypothetical protein